MTRILAEPASLSAITDGEFWRMADSAGVIAGFQRDLRTGVGHATPGLLRMCGLSAEAYAQSRDAYFDLVHPDDRTRCEAAIATALRERAAEIVIEYRLRRRDGVDRWVTSRIRHDYAEDGAPQRVYGVVQDINDSRETVMANAHLAAIVASSGEAIKSYALDGRILSWNPAAERLFGYTAAEIIGQPIGILVPEDKREESRRKIATVAAGRSIRIETVRRRKDGSLVDVSVDASPIRDPGGVVVAVSALAHDISPRQQAQRVLERYRLFSEKMRDILFVIRADDGVIIETNAAAVSAYGRPREAMVGLRIEELRAPAFRATLEEDLARAVSGDHLFETTHIRADGSTFPVEVSAVATEIDGERLVLSLVRDISERKEWARVQRLMTRELLHRVKNSVAVIQSLVRLTAPRARSLEEFASSLTGRLSAMAAAHDLLTDMHWRGADLGDLVAKQLAAYLGVDARIRVSGPRVRLPQHHAVPLALALHELATNAAKHGSLSVDAGYVDLSWSTSGVRDEKLRIEWREIGGPPVAAPTHAGFGSTLIERGLPGAKVDRRYEPGGLTCVIDLDVSPVRPSRAPRAPRKLSLQRRLFAGRVAIHIICN